MADLTLRLVKGTPLTNQEVDDNFSNLNEGQTVAGEPMGHADKAQSTLSFDSSTRTVTIAPVGAEFVVWCKAEKYVFTTAQTVQIPNTTGIYYIYFNASGVLSYRTTYFDWPNDAPTAYVYWNATTGTAPFFADERHGITLDWQTHEYLHRTRGAALANGFSIANYTTTGTGSADADAQFDLSGGTFFDEDLQVDITATSTPVANTWQQDLTGPAQIPVFYRSGTSWVRDTPTNFVLKAGTATPRYNTEAAGVWGLTDVPNNSYSNVWILATNNLNYPVIAIMGQYADGNASNVENSEWSNLNLDGFPVFEFRPLYKIVFQCSTNYANTIKARFTKVFDIRNLAAASVAATIGGSHSTLSGLGSDDHLQYLHISEVRTPSAAVTNSFLPVQAGQTGKYLTTDGSNPSWGALPSSSLTFTGDVTGSGNTGSSTALTLAASGVAAGTYGSATAVPVITVDTKGRLTSVTTNNISGSLSFTGDVTGLGNTGSATTLTLANSGVTAGAYGDANNIPQLTVDAKGRITAVSNVAVNIPSGSLTFTGDVTGTGSTGSSTTLTLANSGVAAGTYTKVTVDAKGRVTTGAALASGDLPTYTGSLISSQITNALGYTPLSNAVSYLPLTGGTLTGALNILKSGDPYYFYFSPTFSELQLGGDGVGIDMGATTNTYASYIQVKGANGTSLNLRVPKVTNNYSYVSGGGVATTGAQLRFVVESSVANSTSIVLAAHTGSAFTTYTFGSNGAFQVPTEVRAPIFYDSNNTAYYLDPAATSQINTIEASNGSGFRSFKDGSASISSQIYFGNAANNRAWNWQLDENNFAALWQYDGSTWAKRFGVENGSVNLNVSRLKFKTADAFTGGAYALIGMDWGGTPGTYKDFAVYDYVNSRAMFTVYGATRNADIPGSGIAGADFRAPIFYDSNDTNYYIDPASTSNTALRMRGGALFGPNTTWGAYLSVGTNGHASGSYASVVTTNGNLHLDAVSGSATYINYYAGSNVYFGNGASGGNYAQIGSDGSFRSPIFYDFNDTAYYGDFASNSKLYTLEVNGANANASSDATLYVSATSSNDWGISLIKASWEYGIRYNLAATHTYGIYGQKNGIEYFRVGTDQGYHSASFRAPIFYDSDNTAYYGDFASTSNINALSVATINNLNPAQGVWHTSAEGKQRFFFAANSTTYYRTGQNFVWRNNADSGVATLDANGWLRVASGGDNFASYQLHVDGTGYASSDFRAPIFYDSNNTGYYLDPASTGSYLNGLILSGASYFRPNNWIQFDSSYGLYWPNNYGLHILPNVYSTYTQLAILGSKNGYAGIFDYNSAVNLGMYDGSGNGGVYREANGKWFFYYNVANDCMGIGTSSTNSTYGIYCNKGAYLGGRTDVTILYDANDTAYYGDFASASNINALTATRIGVNPSGSSSNGHGISLYSGYSASEPTYGLMFQGTGTFGTYGGVSGDWATYFTMSTDSNRGWIFRKAGSGNVASIANDGRMSIDSHFEQGNNFAHPNIEWSASSTSSGMVIFYLPGTTGNYGMVHMVFDIYEYDSPRICTVIVGGHNWSTSWYNTGCNVVGYTDKSVRLGVKDGRFVVVFGTSGSSWSYGTIRLRKIHNGSFYNNQMDMVGNWSVTQTTTESFTNVSGDLRALRTPSTMTVDGILYGLSNVRSPIFYDNDNTAYYGDFASSSYLNNLFIAGTIRNNGSVADDDSFGLYFDSGASSSYAIYRGPGAWTSPYPDLRIAFHTGIQIGAYSSYGGIRFYDNDDMVTQVMSVNNSADGAGGGNVYVNNSLVAGSSLRAPIFYDSNNTAYYVDPTSSGTSLRAQGDWRSDASAWSGEFSGKIQYHANNWYLQFLSNMVFRNSGGTNVMTCDSSGNVTFSGNVTAYSDARIKENIVTIDSALDKATKLRGVYYNKIGSTDRRSGVVAQEVIDIFPEVVRLVQDTDPSTGETKELYAVDYGNLVGLLIEAVKELSAKVDELQKRN